MLHVMRVLSALLVSLALGMPVAAVPQEESSLMSHKKEEKPLKGTGTGVTVRATLTREFYRSGYGPGSFTSPAWKVTLVIQNNTPTELQLGDSLIVVEKVKDSWAYAGSYINRATEKKREDSGASNRFTGALSGRERFRLRYGLDYGYEVDTEGSYISVFQAGGQISFSMGHADPYMGLGYGRVSPQAERTIQIQVIFPVGAKEGLREYVAVISPSYRTRGAAPGVARRNIFRFQVGEPKTDESFQPSDTRTVRVATPELRTLATDVKEHLWLRIFALNWLAETDLAAAAPLLIEAATTTSNPDIFRNLASVNLGTWKVKAAVQPLISVAQEADNMTVRRWALDALGDIGDPAAAPAVRAFLDAPDEGVASAAIESIGELKDSEAVPALLAILRNDKRDKRHGDAAAALAAITSPEAVSGLSELLRDPQSKVRKLAAEKLGKTNSPQAVAPLVEAAANAGTPREVHHTALAALGQLGGAEALAALRRATDNQSEDTRNSALIALGETKDASGVPALIELAERSGYASRQKAVTLLSSKKKTEALPALRRIIGDALAPSKVRQEACEGVRDMKDEQAIPALLGVMNDADGELYEKALQALTGVKAKELVPTAVNALGSRHAPVRDRAAVVLRETKTAEAVAPLWQAYQRETESSPAQEIVRSLIALKFADAAAASFLTARLDPKANKLWSEDVDLLKHLGGAEAVAALRRAADSDNDQFRRQAFNALADTPGTAGVGVLIELAEHAGYAHRERAVETLNWKKKTEALPALRRIVADAQAPSKVRQEACSALENMKDEQGAQALVAAATDADGELYARSLGTLRRIGAKQAVPSGISALSSRHANVRQQATDLLKEAKAPQAVAPLWEAYQRETEEWPARQMAGALIDLKFSDPGAVAFLTARIDPKRNKQWEQDIRLLAYLGGAEAIAALRRAAESGDQQLTREGLDGLAESKDPAGVATLIELAELPGYAHREQAIRVLNWKKKTEGLPALRRVVADAQAPSKLRQDACDALRNMNDSAGIPSLLMAANDTDGALYAKALDTLGSLGGKEVPAALLAALSSRHAPVRERAANLLRQSRPAEAVNPLWQAYQKETEESPAEDIATSLIEMKFNDQTAVGFLVARLDAKRNKLWYQDVRLLRHLTGQTFGPDNKWGRDRERDVELTKWRDWWAQKR